MVWVAQVRVKIKDPKYRVTLDSSLMCPSCIRWCLRNLLYYVNKGAVNKIVSWSQNVTYWFINISLYNGIFIYFYAAIYIFPY